MKKQKYNIVAKDHALDIPFKSPFLKDLLDSGTEREPQTFVTCRVYHVHSFSLNIDLPFWLSPQPLQPTAEVPGTPARTSNFRRWSPANPTTPGSFNSLTQSICPVVKVRLSLIYLPKPTNFQSYYIYLHIVKKWEFYRIRHNLSQSEACEPPQMNTSGRWTSKNFDYIWLYDIIYQKLPKQCQNIRELNPFHTCWSSSAESSTR